MKTEEIKKHLKDLSIEELHNINRFIEYLIETKNVGNIPVGETFKFLGKEYVVKPIKDNKVCKDCVFLGEDIYRTCKRLCCLATYRYDNQNVIFVEKENNN